MTRKAHNYAVITHCRKFIKIYFDGVLLTKIYFWVTNG